MAFFLYLGSLILLAQSDDSISKNQKAERLRSLSYRHGGIIPFTADEFNEYVIQQPRPYTLVVLFTTFSEKYKCITCDEVMYMYKQVVFSYKESGADLPITASGQKTRAVFFAVLEYSQNTHSIYQKFGFASVPNILITHPRSIQDNGGKFQIFREDIWEINPNVEIHTQKILDFVNGRSQRSVELKTPLLEAIINLVYSVGFIALAAYLVYALRKFLVLPIVWFVGSIIVYVICMSGVVYNMIHGVPWIGTTSKGEPEYIHSGQRSQFGLEGFLMSFLISTSGVALIGINLVSKIKNTIHARIAGWVFLGLLIYSLSKVIGVYRVKANWYGPGMSPPGHYIRGPLIRDQGNSF